jgi:hypothetical protein
MRRPAVWSRELPHTRLGTAPVVGQPVRFDGTKPLAGTGAPANSARRPATTARRARPRPGEITDLDAAWYTGIVREARMTDPFHMLDAPRRAFIDMLDRFAAERWRRWRPRSTRSGAFVARRS